LTGKPAISSIASTPPKLKIATLFTPTPDTGGGCPPATRTPSASPTASSLRLEIRPPNPFASEGESQAEPTNGVHTLAIGRCYRVRVVTQNTVGQVIPATQATALLRTTTTTADRFFRARNKMTL
jgi:hypothetical protein